MIQMVPLHKTLKWFGTICSVSILALWLSSGGYWVYLSDGKRVTLYIVGGVLKATVYPAPGIKATPAASGRKPFALHPGHLPSWRPFRLWEFGPNTLQLPLSVVFAATFVPTLFFWLWALRRRVPQGHCRTCGYDLTGNTSGICPECGTAIESR